MPTRRDPRRCGICGQLTLDGSKAGLDAVADAKLVCRPCRDALYEPCPDCGRHHPHERMVEVLVGYGREDGKCLDEPVAVRVCPACARQYKACPDCSGVDAKLLFHVKTKGVLQISQRSWVCPEHADNYRTCESCAKVLKRDQMYHVPKWEKRAGKWQKHPRDVHWYCSGHRVALQVDPAFEPMPETYTAHAYGSCSKCGQRFLMTDPHKLLPPWGTHQADRRFWQAGELLCPEHKDKFARADCGHVVQSGSTSTVTAEEHAALWGPMPEPARQADTCADGMTLALSSPSYAAPTDTVEMLAAAGIRPGQSVCSECHTRIRHFGQLRQGRSPLQTGLRSTSASYVRSYSYTPRPLVIHVLPTEAEPALTMGIELETAFRDGGKSVEGPARDVLARVGQQHVYLKHDGSIGNGFEEVTHPATLAYMLSQRPRYNSLLEIPRAAGMLSHDSGSCGLHVHVGRSFYGPGRSQQARHLAKLILMTEIFWPELFIFSRRTPERAGQWAGRYFAPPAQKGIRGQLPAAMKVVDSNGGGNRYRTLNLQRDGTYEFRIFRGTLNETTFWATLQLVDNLVRLARDFAPADFPKLAWRQVVDYAPWPELSDYNKRHVGDGWSGKMSYRARQLADLAEEACLVEIPNTLAKELQDRACGDAEGVKIDANGRLAKALLDAFADRPPELLAACLFDGMDEVETGAYKTRCRYLATARWRGDCIQVKSPLVDSYVNLSWIGVNLTRMLAAAPAFSRDLTGILGAVEPRFKIIEEE